MGLSEKWKSRLSNAGTSMTSGASAMDAQARDIGANIHAVSYKRGGKVRKTGVARLHKGELVIPRNKVRKVKRAMRRKGRG